MFWDEDSGVYYGMYGLRYGVVLEFLGEKEYEAYACFAGFYLH